MRTIFSKTPSPSRSPPQQRKTFSESLIEENIDTAQSLIHKWDPSPDHCTVSSLFRENPQEAKLYLHSVKDLQSSMHHFSSENPNSHSLIRAQNLMQTAMKRLEREFYKILSSNREVLDAESVSGMSSKVSRLSLSDFEEDDDDVSRVSGDSSSESDRVSITAMADLKSIADCMISAGYAKECVKIYKIIRKSIVDEGLYHLGVEKMNFNAVQKMDWEVLEIKIRNWLNAVKIAVKTLFYGERLLCDHVFSAYDTIRESCFADICKDGGLALFGFPEMVGKCKKSPEKMFRTLDLYEAISNLWPEIESIFSFESTLAVRSEAMTALLKLAEAARVMLTDFENQVQQEVSKTPLPGGGVHPLTRYVMNYIQFLSDYSESLADIIADWPLTMPSPLPESYFENSDSPVSVRFAWLILVLLCKIDARAELFKDVALSYLFLANNLQYVVVKVRSSNLKHLLGEDWIENHESKVKQYAANFIRMGWGKVFASLPDNLETELLPETARGHFRRFNAAFEEAYHKQSSWTVPDSKLREEIKVPLARKLVPAYSVFYEKNRRLFAREMEAEAVVRFAPDDLGNYLSDLFYGTGVRGSVSSSASTSSISSSGHTRGRSRGN